tara:strand:- start:1512 stop:2294 length:783 start_codon:yes stop_codon:yes gene_type:complete
MLAHFIDSKTFQCGYFKDRQSLFEEYLLEDISEVEFEYLLANGMRHFGEYFFRPRCMNCHECVPIRLRPEEFRPSRSQKRALKNCEDVQIHIGTPKFTEEKFELYLAHKERFPSLQDDVEDIENFKLSFYERVPFELEFEYYWNGKLVGAALADLTTQTFSAIYTFYVPPHPKMNLGTFSLTRQIQFALQKGIRYFYMGYFILSNPSLRYKSSFRPNEVYVDQKWVPYINSNGDELLPESSLAWKNNEALVKTKNPHPSK